MAGFIVHLAVASEYIRKNGGISNYDDFMLGIISPDLATDKSKSHYGIKTSKTNLKAYLDENVADTDYDKGYFLHLLTDYLFYNKYLDNWSNDIYNDYDITNKILTQKYNVIIPEIIKDKIFFKDGITKVMSLNLATKVIDEISELEIYSVIDDINKNENKYLKYKKLR